MKRILIGLFLILNGLSFSRADSVVVVTVSGAASGSQTFHSTMNQPINSGPFSIGGLDFANITLAGNQPGSLMDAFETNTKTAVSNSAGGVVMVSIGFAANDFSLPANSPLSFNASQTVDVVNFAGNDVFENFVGYGDSSNSLTPGTGSPSVTTPCVVIIGNPTSACGTSGPEATFVHSGNFGLNGVESFALVPGQVADFSGSINAVPVPVAAVPESESLVCLLLGTLGVFAAKKRLDNQLVLAK